mmetsp:Transcript_46843/g.69309  ORF Transcript_46843/g.69309 Transcript_46843/m.69309 type:complete len:200 (+) Transcript_46843:63-662(+)|eukprot:CAMPEP_0195519006 /NCGR_PEP_ID=MMETSP0794_2-20130614/14155_1 /TAXON_ID=515487 /ORGANISM="Stephanopyxis turris, Strain CCMP 815" /LENGTH=199 /DNA_ID=CAMNT_0040648073 /DNA_START=63 /DNA_END=662 /DNA_ORIENTATION=+
MPLATTWLLTLALLKSTVYGFGASRVFVGTPVKQAQRLVSEYMAPNPRTLSVSTPIDDAIVDLLGLGVSGAPVVDNSGNLVGFVSASDILHKEETGTLLPMEGSAEDVEAYINSAKKIIAQKVGDMMTPNPLTVESNTSMRSAAAIMAKEKLHRLPVVDDGKLVGVLSCFDVMKDVISTATAFLPESLDEPSVQDSDND